MKKLLFYLLASVCIIAIATMVGLSNASVQDRLMLSVIQNLMPDSRQSEVDSLSATVCGSRSPIPSPGRAQTCVMVKAGEDIFIVDIGDGSANNLRNWNIPFNKIKSVLLTHLHSDHISDLADLHLATWLMEGRTKKLDVYGPQGVSLVTRGFEEAYKLDYSYRNAHHGEEIAPLAVAGFNPHPIDLDNPIIFDDNSLKVTAFEVIHEPVKPALGYRFDYKGRSIVITGDTSFSKNVIDISKGVDVLFHEAQANHMVSILENFNLENGAPLRAKLMADIKTYHTTLVEAAELANKAEVRQLIFYHLTPAPRSYITEKIFTRGVNQVRKNWVLSNDGTRVVLPVETDEINLSEIN